MDRRRYLALAATGVAGTLAGCLGGDGPARTWPMRGVDPANTGHHPDATGPTENVRGIWSENTGLVSRPVVDDGTVVVNTPEGLQGLEGDSGDQEWQIDASVSSLSIIEETIYGVASPGVVAVDPAEESLDLVSEVDGSHQLWATGTMTGLVSALDSESVTLAAVDLGTGSTDWSHEVQGWSIGCGVADGLVVVIEQRAEEIRALDLESGDEEWARDGSGSPEANPVIADGTVYVGGDGLTALDLATGTEKWRREIGPVNEPTIANGQVVVGGSVSGDLHSLDTDGDHRWEVWVGGTVMKPLVVQETVYAPTNSAVRAFDMDGRELWHEHAGDHGGTGEAAVVDETVYLSSLGTLAALQEGATPLEPPHTG